MAKIDPNHNLFGGWFGPACADASLRKQNPFFNGDNMKYSVNHDAMQHITKSILMCASLFVIWYIVLVLVNYYNAGFHLIATFSSAVMVGMGKSWGVVDRILK